MPAFVFIKIHIKTLYASVFIGILVFQVETKDNKSYGERSQQLCSG